MTIILNKFYKKMWATFDESESPNIKVSLIGTPENDEDFDLFLNKWISLQKQQKNFSLIFDTTQVGWVNPKYAFKMVKFIRYLKTFEKQYLKKSIILVKDNYTLFLLKLIFIIQTPVAPVFIVKEKEEIPRYYNKTETRPLVNYTKI